MSAESAAMLTDFYVGSTLTALFSECQMLILNERHPSEAECVYVTEKDFFFFFLV